MTTESNKPIDASLLNKSLADILAARVTEFANSQKMLEIIDAKIEGCMTSVIDDVFGRWSDFSKGASEAFKSCLPGNINNVIELGRYNAMIEERLRVAFASSGIANDLVVKAQSVLKEAMDEELLPPVIKLSAFIEAYIESNAERAGEERWEKPDFRMKDDDGCSGLLRDYKDFYFDDACESGSNWRCSSKSDYSLANFLRMRAIEGEMFEGEQVYEVWSAKLDDKFIQNIVSVGKHLSKWEKMVFALYYGQSKIIIDCDPDDYGYPGYDD